MLHTLPHCTVLYVNYISITLGRRNSLEIQWLECCLPMQRVWDRSLVWELRSHMTCGPKKNPPKHKQKQYCNKFTEDFKNHPLGKNIKKKKKRNGQNWRLLISLLTVKLEDYPTMMFIFGEAKILRNWEKLGGAPWHCTANSPPLHRGGLGLPPAITGASSPRWPIPSTVAHPFRAGPSLPRWLWVPSPGSCFVDPEDFLLGFSPFYSFASSFLLSPMPVFIHNSMNKTASRFPLLLWVRISSLKVKYRSPGSVFLIWAADRGKKGQELEPGLG